MPPTTYDIAKLAGVHQSTVSRVLSGAPHVKKKTADRVWRACRKLDYVPNTAARSLRTQRSQALAVHLPLGPETVLADPFVPMFLAGVHAASARRGYSVVLNCDAFDNSPAELVELVKSHRADGVILTSTRREDPRIDALAGENIPTVLGRHNGPASETSACVDIDNRQIGRRSAEFLLQRGHRAIGLVAEAEVFWSGTDFLAGFREALLSAGVEPQAGWLRQAPSTFDSARNTTAEILTAPVAPTAIVATTPLTVFGVLEAVQNHSSPVTVLGIDSPLLRSLQPGLPRIVSPIEEMGKSMVDSLIDLIETDEPVEPVMLRSEIVDEQGHIFQEMES